MKMDFQYKFANLPVWYEPKGEKRDQLMNVLWNEHLPVYLKGLDGILNKRPDLKFLCGDQITIYDI